jgi:AcrR family transcriptional regulator
VSPRAARTPPPAPVRRKVGRPAQLTREQIVEAAHEIGIDNLTMKTVADHLGVSVPGLYHYVRGKDDLMRLAAELSAGRMELPKDHGQHWAVWLYEWAVYNRRAFMAQPGLLKQFLDGAIGADRQGAGIDTALGTLVKQGFTIREARTVYSVVSEFAVGAAVAAIRERQAAADGRPTLAEYHKLLAVREPDELPYLRAMVADITTEPSDGFHRGLLLLLRGIAAERDEKWLPIQAKLRRLPASKSHA